MMPEIWHIIITKNGMVPDTPKVSGEEIPLSARILAVADVYDALTSQRTYKNAFSHEKAVSILLDEDGISFDPRIMQVFREIEYQFAEAKLSFS